MAPSRTKQSRQARRIRRVYFATALAYEAGDATAEQLQRAEARFKALALIGWETRAEGHTGADDEEDGDEADVRAPRKAPKSAKKTPKSAKKKPSAKAAVAAAVAEV